MDDTIEHVSKAFLGLTMNWRSVTHTSTIRFPTRTTIAFAPSSNRIRCVLDAVPGETDLEKDGVPRAFDAHLEAPTYLHLRGDEKNPDQQQPMAPGVPEILGGDWRVESVELPAIAWRPALRPFVLDDHLRIAEQRIAAAQAERDAADEKLRASESRLAESGKTPSERPAAGDSGLEFLSDEFESLREDVWEVGAGQWTCSNGQLVQSAADGQRSHVRSKQPHPEDFEAVVRFTTTGGQMWKSVGLTFDVAGGDEKLVYLSAVSPGSKVQVSYKTEAGQVYPAEAAKARAVELNTPHELRVAVQGSLVNVAVDGQHQIAYRLPVPRTRGRVELITFDATASFDSFTIRSLASDVLLIEPGQTTPLTVRRAAASIENRRQVAGASAAVHGGVAVGVRGGSGVD